jgi:uncharacterized protein (DUF433 family)
MSETTILAPHIAQTPGVRGGRPYVEGKGVAVAFVARMSEAGGLTADEIAENFRLTLGEVHAALSYYFDHLEEMQARQAEDDALVREMMDEREALPAVPKH